MCFVPKDLANNWANVAPYYSTISETPPPPLRVKKNQRGVKFVLRS